MRDIRRIGTLVHLFTLLWMKMPDMRFFQMVSLVQSKVIGIASNDPYYVEDDVVITTLQKFLVEVGE